MKTSSSSMMILGLRWLADAVYRFPRWFIFPQIILFALCVFYTVEKLEFDTNRDNLVGKDKKYHQNFLKFKDEFPGQDDLVTIVESEDTEKNRQFVERLGARLDQATNLFTDVIYKGDLKMMGPKALLFMTNETQLVELQQTLKDYRPFIQSFSRATNLNSLFRLVNQQFRTAKQEQNADNDSMVRALPALERIINQAGDSLSRPGRPPSPGIEALFSGGEEAEESQYIVFAKNRIYLVTARARTEELNGAAVEKLRELVRATQAEVPGVNVGITGESVLEFDEMNQSQHDTTLATTVSLALAALIFIYGYQETGRPIKATLCLVIGLGYTMGFATLVVGHLNILTITFVPMLIGIAIDFGVHLISRYEEELRLGHSDREALEKAMVFTGMGIFTGCFTTAGAFLAMAVTNFKGIQEMGLIAGGGLLICLVPMMTMLPSLLLRGRQNALDHRPAQEPIKRMRLEQWWLSRPWLVVGFTATTCALALTQFHKVYFDYNLLNMQSAGLPAVVFEKKLIESTPKSVLFGAVLATNLQDATRLEARIRALPAVESVDSMVPYLTGDQTRKLQMIGEIKREVSAIHFAEDDDEFSTPNRARAATEVETPRVKGTTADLKELTYTLTVLQGYLSYALDAVQKEGNQELYRQLKSLRQAIGQFVARVNAGDPLEVAFKIAAFQHALFQDIRDTFAAIQNQDNSAPLQPQNLPPVLRDRFIGRTGKILLQVYPKKDIWQREPQEEFVKQLRTVDPDVTGTPVQLYEYTSLLKDSYVRAAWYALGAIIVLVFFHFRTLSSVVFSLLPVMIGTIWLVGFMGLFGIPFNPANIMTLPLVIGIGVTNGIHILNRFAEEKTAGIFGKSTGKAVLVSALTTISGFGSLILAKHQGIASLGYVMATGTAACMIAALTFLPAALKLTYGSVDEIKNPMPNMHERHWARRNRGKNLK